MKNLLFLFLCLISTQTFAQVLINFSESNPSYEREVLFQKLSLPLSTIENYRCQSSERFALFTNDQQINTQENSLRIQNAGKVFVYHPGESIESSDEFIQETQKTLDLLFNLKTGRPLVFALMRSPYPVTIVKGMYRFDPSDEGERSMFHLNESSAVTTLSTQKMNVEGLPYLKIGSGGRVRFNPSLVLNTLEADGVSRAAPNASSLAHEMYHAYDSIRGILDMRHVKWDTQDFAAVMEYRAVYLENFIRKELGRKYRYSYSAQDIHSPGLLDSQGEPVFFPSPCLE